MKELPNIASQLKFHFISINILDIQSVKHGNVFWTPVDFTTFSSYSCYQSYNTLKKVTNKRIQSKCIKTLIYHTTKMY